jgi:hypothetical protein
VAFGCQSAASDGGAESSREQLATSGGVRLLDVPNGGAVWISGSPSREDLDLARRRGVAAAIDVSTPDEAEGREVARACAEFGIEYVGMRCDNRDRMCDELVDRVLAELRQRSHEAVMLFSGDSSRAAMLLAIHRIVDEHLPIERALVEARRSGMKPGYPEIFVRSQVLRLEPHP